MIMPISLTLLTMDLLSSLKYNGYQVYYKYYKIGLLI